MDKYDYIIVGAGLAGGILARKLTENNKKKSFDCRCVEIILQGIHMTLKMKMA